MNSQKRRPRRGKPGDLTALKRELWYAVVTAADMLDSADAQVKLKAVHATSQAAGVYRNLCETLDLEARIARLEAAMGADDG
jgi:hypothetical protein